MITTLLVAVLVLISLGLVVTVPVALATPGEWEASKGKYNRFFQSCRILCDLFGK